jgi:hypothetical protein
VMSKYKRAASAMLTGPCLKTSPMSRDNVNLN